MTYDAKVPKLLKGHQQWFASIITRPLDEKDRMQQTSPTDHLMESEAATYIDPSPTLKSHERIEIYNQQYWWRLLGVLHDAFPLVTRLFGYSDFNDKIGFPYLVKYPSDHFSIDAIGKRLCQWIEEDYKEPDKSLVYDAAAVDWAFVYSFTAQEHPPLELADLTHLGEELLEKTLYLQPHVHLFSLPYNLFLLRREFLAQDVEYWVECDFPPLERSKTFYFALSRRPNNDVSWEEISCAEYELLMRFKGGTSLDAACEWLENQEEFAVDEELQVWLHDWVVTKWLTLSR